MGNREQLLNGDLLTITKDRAIENADNYDHTKYTNNMIITKMNQNIETINNRIEECSMKGRYDMTVDMPLEDATAIYTLANREIPIIDELFKAFTNKGFKITPLGPSVNTKIYGSKSNRYKFKISWYKQEAEDNASV